MRVTSPAVTIKDIWDALVADYGVATSYGLLLETNLDAKVSESGADLTDLEAAVAGLEAEPWGSGSDGDVTISANTEVTRTMFYDDLTVDAAKILSLNDPTRPHVMVLFVKGTLTVNGSIRVSGKGGAAGAAGVAGGDGGAGGAGGAGGGILYIFAKTVVVGAAGTIQANGVDGSDAENFQGDGGQGGGGGGGGSGGLIIIYSTSITNGGTIEATAGGAGAGGTGSSATGSDTNGSVGGTGGASILFGVTYVASTGGYQGQGSAVQAPGGGGGASIRADGGAGGAIGTQFATGNPGTAGARRNIDHLFHSILGADMDVDDTGGGGGGGGGGGAETDYTPPQETGGAGAVGQAGFVHLMEVGS